MIKKDKKKIYKNRRKSKRNETINITHTRGGGFVLSRPLKSPRMKNHNQGKVNKNKNNCSTS